MTPTVRALMAVALGGAVGTYLRVGIGALADVQPGQWPWPTLAANLLGTWLLAVLGIRLTTAGARGVLLPLLGTGVCGALTTFSAMQVETIEIWRESGPSPAIAYALLSVSAGLTIVALVTRAAGPRR